MSPDMCGGCGFCYGSYGGHYGYGGYGGMYGPYGGHYGYGHGHGQPLAKAVSSIAGLECFSCFFHEKGMAGGQRVRVTATRHWAAF